MVLVGAIGLAGWWAWHQGDSSRGPAADPSSPTIQVIIGRAEPVGGRNRKHIQSVLQARASGLAADCRFEGPVLGVVTTDERGTVRHLELDSLSAEASDVDCVVGALLGTEATVSNARARVALAVD